MLSTSMSEECLATAVAVDGSFPCRDAYFSTYSSCFNKKLILKFAPTDWRVGVVVFGMANDGTLVDAFFVLVTGAAL